MANEPQESPYSPPAAAAPVPYQPPPPVASERVVISAPMSFHGSAARLWKLSALGAHPGWKVLTVPAAVALVACAWVVILCWYVIFSVFLVPYRLVRRGSRRRKREALQHRETLAAIERQHRR